jgi:hypothetical protein
MVEPGEGLDDPDLGFMDDEPVLAVQSPLEDPRIRIVAEREGGLVEAYVPIDLIRLEDVPVDQAHVADLAASMRKKAQKYGGTGQQSPSLVAYVPGCEQLLITDGFHRAEALRQNGATEVYTTIKLESTMEEVLDDRIEAANKHKSVKFARQIEWVEQAWALTPWSGFIATEQAFALAAAKTQPDSSIGLEPDDMATIREWVDKKCAQWGSKPKTIYNNLSIAGIADPELVKEARADQDPGQLTYITPSHLDVIARTLPLNYRLQTAAANVAKAQNLSIQHTKKLVNRMVNARTPMKLEAILQAVEDNPEAFFRVKSRAAKKRNPTRRSGGRSQAGQAAGEALSPEGLEELLVDELDLAKLSIENVVLRGAYRVPPVAAKRLPAMALGPLEGLPQGVGERGIFKKATSVAAFDQAREQIAALQDQIVPRLPDQYKLDEWVAAALADDVGNRILEDMRSGALQYAPLETYQLNMIFVRSLRAQIGVRKNRELKHAMQGAQDEELPARLPAETVRETASPTVSTTVEVIMGSLTEFDFKQRRMLILSTFFNLSSFAIGQVLGQPEKSVNAALSRIAIKIEDKTRAADQESNR